MFREKFRHEIETVLSNSHTFSSYDFSIEMKDPRRGLVNIIYTPDKQYFIKFSIPNSRKDIKRSEYTTDSFYYYEAEIAPWEAAKVEKVTFTSKSEFLKGINSWMEFLEEDLISVPLNRKFKVYEEKLSEYASFIDKMDTDYFTAEEAELLKSKIDDLQNQMIININSLNKQGEEKEKLINDLKFEIEALKSKVEILDKKGVIRSIIGRVLQWSTKPENQKLIGDGANLVRTLIDNK